jgi:hypothetical protein
MATGFLEIEAIPSIVALVNQTNVVRSTVRFKDADEYVALESSRPTSSARSYSRSCCRSLVQ